MDFWTVFWIWFALVVSALVVLALIGYSLFQKGASVFRQASKLSPILEKLHEAIDQPPNIASPESNLNDDPKVHVRARQQLLRAKAKKREDRQRRLIKQLKEFDPKESRFQ